ncbi:hypothetical protein DFJ43DRAFT_1043308 [Lentinula guzmanii]|uniref:Uncharacterized protein n=1 Tax=Lentinula guzmanii TaxID=2804957 RepID=A0AA38J826_9AGAR|nr:hypothetical protein DFJ43DRAFT_1043308 [Lentinula guzmanii]
MKLTSDHLVWNNCLQPELIEWCGTREGQFSLSNDLKFHEIIKMLWDKHLGSLPHVHDTYKIGSTVYQCRDHPAILSFAQQQVRNYRSKMGQTGLDVVEAKMRTFTTVEERKDYAERMILRDAFIFETPGATASFVFFSLSAKINEFISVRRARGPSVVTMIMPVGHSFLSYSFLATQRTHPSKEQLYMELLAQELDPNEECPDDGELEGSGDEYEDY